MRREVGLALLAEVGTSSCSFGVVAVDSRRFDGLVRAVAQSSSRRSLAAVFGVLSTFLLALITDAKNGRSKRRSSGKHRDNDKNNHNKKAKRNRNQKGASGGNLQAEKKKKKPTQTTPTPTTCPSGQTRCGSACVDTKSDSSNCGACGTLCSTDQICSQGSCTCNGAECNGCCDGNSCRTGDDDNLCGSNGETCVACTGGQHCESGECVCHPGEDFCDETCVDTAISESHCGQCGITCESGQLCEGGSCTCNGVVCNGCCDNATCQNGDSRDFCGSHGEICQVCNAGQTCVEGDCVCDPASCNGCCDGNTCRSGDSTAFCGTNGTTCDACTGGKTCQNGVCACPTGLTLCDGVCVNLKTNAAHCDQCGRACAAGNFCEAGFCRVPCGDRGTLSACLEGSSLPNCCNGVCKNILLDGSDCGACGHHCQDFGGNVCIQGQCKCGFTQGVCANGLSCCPPVVDGSLGSCENLKSDRNHCGECHKPCPAGSTGCVNGVCKCGAGVACSGNRPDCCADGCTNKRFSLAHCGACGAACPAGRANMCLEGVCKCGTGPVCNEFQTCCTGGNSGAGTCRDINFDVNNCGTCGNVCPGAGQATVEVSCDRKVCLESRCIGLNFDLNNNWADGCEVADTATNHGESSQYLGATDCKDSRGGTFSGTLYSDRRKHTEGIPSVINPDTGSAALVYRVYGGYNPFCENDPYVKVTMTGGTSGCYSVTITTVERTQSAVIVNGTAEVHMPNDSYPDGTEIYFTVAKTCSVPTNEVATFTAKYHL